VRIDSKRHRPHATFWRFVIWMKVLPVICAVVQVGSGQPDIINVGGLDVGKVFDVWIVPLRLTPEPDFDISLLRGDGLTFFTLNVRALPGSCLFSVPRREPSDPFILS
jgi:hypothetical protein